MFSTVRLVCCLAAASILTPEEATSALSETLEMRRGAFN